MPPRICIVIVNWNSWALLEQCLDALARQTRRDFTTVVVDNASTQPMPASLAARHPDVEFVHNMHNLGFAAANNQIILARDAEWFALLNPDAFPEPDWLARLMEAAERHPDCAAFGSRQLAASDPALLDGDGDAYHISGLPWRRGYRKPVAGADASVRETFSPCAAAALYRGDILWAAGGFDQDFFCYVEDVDLGFRLRLDGQYCLQIPDAVVRHAGSATTGGRRSDFAAYHGHRNLVWCYVKNMPGILFWLLLPLHLALNLVTMIVLALRGQGSVALRAKRDALAGLPKMWRKRREIQKDRTATIAGIWRAMDKGLWKR